MEDKRLIDGSLALSGKQHRVITIEAAERPLDIKLRVAAYARVSTASDDQLNSFAAQITHCAPDSVQDALSNGSYLHDRLTGFLESIKTRAKFHYWLFGHYHNNKIIDDRFVLLWEQLVQVV